MDTKDLLAAICLVDNTPHIHNSLFEDALADVDAWVVEPVCEGRDTREILDGLAGTSNEDRQARYRMATLASPLIAEALEAPSDTLPANRPRVVEWLVPMIIEFYESGLGAAMLRDGGSFRGWTLRDHVSAAVKTAGAAHHCRTSAGNEFLEKVAALLITAAVFLTTSEEYRESLQVVANDIRLMGNGHIVRTRQRQRFRRSGTG